MERVGAAGRIQFFADEKDTPLGELLEEAGYSVVRSSYEMERSIEGELGSPSGRPVSMVRTLDLA